LTEDDRTDNTEHYFSAEPQVPSAPVLVRETIRGMKLRLWTDRGVFSRGKLDAGSKLLAETFEIGRGHRVLDWGAGYGVLGIVAALVEPSCTVTMVEVNQRAADLARRNLTENSVSNATVPAGSASEVLGNEQFDTIISNPPVSKGKAVVQAMIADAHARLADGGCLWLVIHTRRGAKSYLKYMQTLFENSETVRMKGGYRVLAGWK
jgi:16S rRNA (guanine1207-N2)-methyltransferase